MKHLILCVTIVIINAYLCSSQESWGDPSFIKSDDERVDFSMSGQDVILQMDEEIPPDITVAYLNYAASLPPTITSFYEGTNDMLGAVFTQEREGGYWSLVVTHKIDFELMTGIRFYFDITINGSTRQVYLFINNIDDNPPVIIILTNPCEIEENYVGKSNCFYNITDPDGWLQYMHWTISGSRDEDKLFRFEYTEEIQSNNTYMATVELETIQALDYQNISVHVFDWTVIDSGKNNVTQSIVVNVIDTRDTNPIWTSIFYSQTFDEKTNQLFTVTAIDGDTGINDPIKYNLDNFDWENKEVSIDSNTGEIIVNNIDRDFYDREIFTFQVIAAVVTAPEYYTTQDITFVVNDINDNSPYFYSPENKTIYFEIPEEMYTTLDAGIRVIDIDTGENAFFTISLRDDSDASYNRAFQIAPDTGYRNMSFSLFINDSSLLDYETEEWQSFSFEVYTEETKNTSHTDTMVVQIDLINWNDEVPIFELEEYTVTVNETIGINEFLITVYAEDRDIGDYVTHRLTGSSIQRILSIDEDTGDITTIAERAFNYERQTEVIIQVAATDNFIDMFNTPLHTTYAQVTVEVLDINDETPVITVLSMISVEENRPNGTIIETNITATDEDTTADLLFSFDWDADSTFATKNGRKIDLDRYKRCIDVVTENISQSSSGYARAVLSINELVPLNTPDYEIFDTLYLQLTVEDQNQQVGIGTASVTLTINIIDLNDNKPIFTDSIKANNTVTEGAAEGTTIGTVTATDADGPLYNNVTYSIKEADETPPNLVAIDAISGLLTVISRDIDADDPPTWYLNYSVTASDGYWYTTEIMRIYIIDINDNTPIIQDYNAEVFVEEQSSTGTDVIQLYATDRDRDSPFNVVWYQFSGPSSEEFRSGFSIGQDSGLVFVELKGGYLLDRDFGTKRFTITFRASDNFPMQGGTQRYNESSFEVILTDINNQVPEILNTSLTLSENINAGTTIDEVLQAHDYDEPYTNNTKINFTILGITNDDGPLDVDLFSISTDDNFETGVAQLMVLRDLQGYYGNYWFEIQTNDFGTYPQTNYVNNTLALIIDKYNFHEPVFIYPEDGQRIFLAKTYTTNSQLYLYNGDRLDYIKANDMQGNKWDITFSVVVDGADETTNQIFKIDNSDAYGQSTGMLQIANTPTMDTLYTVIITAEDHGTPPLTSTAHLNVRFFDLDSLPFFSENQRSLSVKFTENETGLHESAEIYKASYNEGVEDWDFPIYYLLLADDSGVFVVDINTGEITLSDMLDREEQDSHVLKILASNSENRPGTYTDESVLTVYVEVIDVNDNPPHFTQSVFTAGISTTNSVQDMILQLPAYDLDISDNLTFFMKPSSLITTGNAITEITNPFVVERDAGFVATNSTIKEGLGLVYLNFRVQSNMDGYFSFVAVVQDSPPEYHTDESEVQIYIIGDQYRIKFTFENTLDRVNELQDTIKEVLEEQFHLICNIESILKYTDDNGTPNDTLTVVTTHFIDSTINQPVNRSEIESSLNNVSVFFSLRDIFLNYTLLLAGYGRTASVDPNTGEGLKMWFIGVTSVLVVLLFGIITIFIIKLRSVTQRLKNLSTTKFGSQESGLNRMGVAAPNTNKNAIEGSNPVYNDEKKMPDLDDTSIYSGDSDLIGVEDNPEFDMVMRHYEEDGIDERQ